MYIAAIEAAKSRGTSAYPNLPIDPNAESTHMGWVSLLGEGRPVTSITPCGGQEANMGKLSSPHSSVLEAPIHQPGRVCAEDGISESVQGP